MKKKKLNEGIIKDKGTEPLEISRRAIFYSIPRIKKRKTLLKQS